MDLLNTQGGGAWALWESWPETWARDFPSGPDSCTPQALLFRGRVVPQLQWNGLEQGLGPPQDLLLDRGWWLVSLALPGIHLTEAPCRGGIIHQLQWKGLELNEGPFRICCQVEVGAPISLAQIGMHLLACLSNSESGLQMQHKGSELRQGPFGICCGMANCEPFSLAQMVACISAAP